jgi:hypothetical protein
LVKRLKYDAGLVNGGKMVKSTNVARIIDRATSLAEKMKEQEDVNQETLANWMYITNDLINSLAKALDRLEERFELLEEIMEK